MENGRSLLIYHSCEEISESLGNLRNDTGAGAFNSEKLPPYQDLTTAFKQRVKLWKGLRQHDGKPLNV